MIISKRSSRPDHQNATRIQRNAQEWKKGESHVIVSQDLCEVHKKVLLVLMKVTGGWMNPSPSQRRFVRGGGASDA